MNSIENAVLRIAGLQQDTIDKIEQASPAAADLIKLIQDNQDAAKEAAAAWDKVKPLIDQLAPILGQLSAIYEKHRPLIDKSTPLVKLAAADVQVILPAAQDVIAFFNVPNAPEPNMNDVQEREGSGPT